MEISELKPVTKTYTSFKLDRMDTPTEVKDILNNHMDFGRVHSVVKTIDENNFTTFKIQYAKSIYDDLGECNFKISVSQSSIIERAYLIINDYNKKATTLTCNTGNIFTTSGSKTIFVEEDNHRIFLTPVTKEDYPNGYSN
jgi:hypothetical protein